MLHSLGIGTESFTESVNDRVPRNAFHGLLQNPIIKKYIFAWLKKTRENLAECPDADKATTKEVEDGGAAEAEAAEAVVHPHPPVRRTSRRQSSKEALLTFRH